MKSRLLLLSLATCPAVAALAQTFPAVDFVSVSANATTGQLRAPTNFFSNTTNAGAMANAVAGGTATVAGRGLLTVAGTTGTGNVVLANSPTLVTPVLGAATGTSLAATGLNATSTFGNINSSTAKTLSLFGADAAGIGLKWQRSVAEKPFYLGALSGTDVVLASEGTIRITANVTADTLTGTTAATFTNTGTTITGNATFSATGNAVSTTNGPHRFGTNIALSGTAGGANFFGGNVLAPDIVLGGATANVSATSSANTRSAAGALAFDGAPNTRVASTLTGQNVGTDSFSVTVTFRVPTANPTFTHGLFFLGTSATTINVASHFAAYVTTNGTLRSEITDGSSAANIRYGDLTTFLSTYAGKVVTVVWVRSSAGSLSVYINGAPVTLAESTGGAGALWSANLTSTYFGLGFVDTSLVAIGTIYKASVYNLALSQADVTELQELGGEVPFRYQNASQVATLTDTFNSTVSPWNDYAGGPSGGAGTMTFTASANGAVVYRLAAANRQLGRAYRLTVVATAATAGIWRFAENGGSAFIGDLTATGTVAFDWISANNGNPNFAIYRATGGAGTLELDSFSEKRIGAVAHYNGDDLNASLQWRDRSSNGLHATRTAAGTTPTGGTARTFYVRGRSDGTTSAQQIGGGNLLPANSRITAILARAQSGTPSITLGTASGGSQLVASTALSTTWAPLTVALSGGIVSADSSVWLTASSANVVEIQLIGDPIAP